ncbi:hypothetical protein TVAGG3_0410380 [Trichomonas vaginalis G3]|uniref:hypothetical protein n=2 Tax=Trichomonas vaginalis (strain ATCC PRA-98 / G3) TaxID=412133 RepID=UPI0021E53770|nr:hypothetical protein TVAGG3_1039550 [Trichomonas vaginalis G3]XP_051100300.1 hypothetical protein TVAGG3_0334080 [Trichomonas vaginalis G3]XP_051102792.1 hypothetical protein TVAGG3_0410380 [Trichomonas vaginalis G3]KAI5493448.1 hypothetical protein TVAGG3_1039550 [Trichomonas vaginalis G3]KAI5530143.1 hypothetical protein TVAGG3_0334080 [Trichomonas vaginalis G3]KAI5535306.1 hypothetical protein TVAGG3_0410380 [Trichomonas vaginalis G3]
MTDIDPADEAIYLIEINELVRNYLSHLKSNKTIAGWVSGRGALKIEIDTGIVLQIPENTPVDDIKEMKKETLLKFFAKRPWIQLPNRENPTVRIAQILRGLLHFSGQAFFINTEGDIVPLQ